MNLLISIIKMIKAIFIKVKKKKIKLIKAQKPKVTRVIQTIVAKKLVLEKFQKKIKKRIINYKNRNIINKCNKVVQIIIKLQKDF